MLFQFATVSVFILLSLFFISAILFLSSFLKPKVSDPEKATIYECGERPIGEAWFNFNPRFYILAIIFIVFDVEIAVTIPVVVVFKDWIIQQRGAVAFFEIFIFLFILTLALVYVWRYQDIRWLKKLGHVSPLKEDERKYYYY